MNPRPSIRFPHLLVYPDGKILDTEKNVYLHNYKGEAARKGPIAYYYENKKSYKLSRLVMVYEAFIDETPVDRGCFVDAIDGNVENTHYTNVMIRKKGSTMSKIDTESRSVVGWNDISEIYC
jgi:hypothetical protein